MQDQESLTPSERELAAALGALRPADTRIDRDRLMYQAGRSSTAGRTRLWQSTTACLAALLAGSLLLRPATTTRDALPVTAQSPTSPKPSPPDRVVLLTSSDLSTRTDARYLILRNDVLARGLSALTSDEPPTSSPSSRASGPPAEKSNWNGAVKDYLAYPAHGSLGEQL
ncbi:MAG: hypothetical protein JXQ73_01520 [Phycisphaerae bacterium]|nr:hypothetical protein [Phycisphaerae bacterium]